MLNIYELMVNAVCTAIAYPIESAMMTVVDSLKNVLADVFAGLFNR